MTPVDCLTGPCLVVCRRCRTTVDLMEHMFDHGAMSASKKAGQHTRYQQCCEAVRRGDLTELRDLAADPDLTTEMLATIAPNRDDDADVDLVTRVLDHPSCSSGIASRYTTHHDPEIRLGVVRFPLIGRASLEILAVDADERVRHAALAELKATSTARTTRGWP